MDRTSTPRAKRPAAAVAASVAAVVASLGFAPMVDSSTMPTEAETSTTAPATETSASPTSTDSTTTSTTATTATDPVLPAGGACAPNWFRGELGDEVEEHGSGPAGLQDALRPLDAIGATVTVQESVVEQRQEGFSVFRVDLVVTVDGVDHRLTTAPHPAYPNYGDRTPMPGSTMSGRLTAAVVDGQTWVQLTRATSGAYGTFAWDLGRCVPQGQEQPGQAEAADARPGSAGYTG